MTGVRRSSVARSCAGTVQDDALYAANLARLRQITVLSHLNPHIFEVPKPTTTGGLASAMTVMQRTALVAAIR